MMFTTVYPLVYSEAEQRPPEVSAKQMFEGTTCFHTGTANVVTYFGVLGFGLRFPSSVLSAYGVTAQQCLVLRRGEM